MKTFINTSLSPSLSLNNTQSPNASGSFFFKKKIARFVFPTHHPSHHPTHHPSHFSPHPIHRSSNPIQPPFTHLSNTPSNISKSRIQPLTAYISPFHHPHVNRPPFKPFKIPSPCNPNVTQCKRFVFPPPSTHIPPNLLILRLLLPFPLYSSLSHFVFTPLYLTFVLPPIVHAPYSNKWD